MGQVLLDLHFEEKEHFYPISSGSLDHVAFYRLYLLQKIILFIVLSSNTIAVKIIIYLFCHTFINNIFLLVIFLCIKTGC